MLSKTYVASYSAVTGLYTTNSGHTTPSGISLDGYYNFYNIGSYAEKDLTIKTFHSFSAMFLRREIGALNFPVSFTILDEEDQLKLIKDIGASIGYKRTDPIIKKSVSYISSKKLKELYPDDIKIEHETFEGEKDCLEIYTLYEENKNKMYSLDFDDLLLKTNQILDSFPIIKEKP